MRDHRERLLKLPYSMGCATGSCVAVAKKIQPKMQKRHAPKHVLFPPPPRKREEKEKRSMAKMRKIRSFFVLPNYDVAMGVTRMITSFKSFPKLFVYENEDEEEEREIEIGHPTDVKHVTHIGLDGATTVDPMKGWEHLQATEVLSLSSISLRQFELAMNAQTGNESVYVSSTKMAQKIID